MSKFDQGEYLKLSNKFKNPNHDKNPIDYVNLRDIINILKNIKGKNIDANLMMEIICIHLTNRYGYDVGIQYSRFNHSCSPNAYNGEKEIRAFQKIKAGEEISVTYRIDLAMKNLATRQESLRKHYGFTCCCELCHNEALNKDEETYQKYHKVEVKFSNIVPICLHLSTLCLLLQILHLYQEEANTAINMEGFEKLPFTKKVDIIAKIVSCFKQMYKMTREKKGPIALLEQLVVKGFKFGFNGYYLALINEDSNKMETFKDECEKLAQAGEQLAKFAEGKESQSAKRWKHKHKDFKNWCQQYIDGKI